VDHAGAKKVYSPIDKETREIDVDNVNSLVTPRTRLLCICNPHNPLGRVLNKKELQGLAEIAVDNDITIMSDEIWSDIVYDDRNHIATASLDPETARRTIGLYGFSKTFAMAGLSIGYAVSTDPETLAGLKQRAPAYFYPVNNVSQAAGKAAYAHAWPWAEAFLEHLQGNRDIAHKRLNEMPGVRCQRPEGTYAIFPDISSHGLTSEEMTRHLLQEAKVAVVPGHGPGFSYFGPGAEGNIRIVYSTTRKILEEALDRIEKTLTNL